MSTFVVVIACLHTLPPIIGAMLSNKKGLLTGTVIAIILAIFLGAGRYTFIDFLGVGIGYFIGNFMCTNKKK